MKVCLVIASSGKNLELGQRIHKVLQEKQHPVEVIEITKLNLPLYTSAMESTVVAAELVAPFRPQLDADAFIFLTPEYNGGVPPALSNFIAWVSRATKNWRDSFNGKPAMMGTVSGGVGHNVLAVLRLQLAYIGMNVLGRQLAGSAQKPVDDESISMMVDQLAKMAGCS